MKTEIIKIIKTLKGNVLGIGLKEEEYLKEIDNNKLITECNLLNSIDLDDDDDSKCKRNKRLNIRSIKKKFKKKRVNYIIVNSKEVEEYLRTFIKDSVYINQNIIYMYIESDIDYEYIIKKYKRYNVKVNVIKHNNGVILKIDTTNSKNKPFKDIFYYCYDTVEIIFNLISDFLAS